MHKKPLGNATVDESQQRQAEYWCWTPAHLEEALVNEQRRAEMFGPRLPVIMHRHHHIEPCNPDCIILVEGEAAGFDSGLVT